MTESELKEKANKILEQIRDKNISDEIIIGQIRENPELIHVKLKTGMNLFMAGTDCDRLLSAKALSHMGADIHWTCPAGEGNALNIAKSPETADALLALGVEIERNLLLSQPFRNPAVVAAGRNNTTMLFYWLEKQKEIFAEDKAYVKELFHAAIRMVSIINQHNMLACVMADDALFGILQDIYANLDDVSSIRLCLRSLGNINDKNLDARKKELRKTLNAAKKRLSGG